MNRAAILGCAFASLISTFAHAGSGVDYNLRTTPPSPAAGQPFQAVFEDTQCEQFMLTTPPAAPPSVQVQGSLVTVGVDRLPVLDCNSPAATYTISVPALDAGTYTLRLLAREMGDPGNEVVEDSITVVVRQATARTHSIPANGLESLGSLGALIALAVLLHSRRR